MPDSWTYKIGSREIVVDLTRLSNDELAVLSLISFEAKKRPSGRITQREIMKSERWLGCHDTHEADINLRNPEETTLRQVRAIIRRLRIEYHVPILSDVKGYWVPETMSEVEDAMQRLEATARAQARSWQETYQELKGAFQLNLGACRAPFLERQAKLIMEDNMALEKAYTA